MSLPIVLETERRLAAHNVRKQYRMGASLLELRKVPVGLSDHGAAAYMREAARIIDEELAKQIRDAEEAARECVG